MHGEWQLAHFIKEQRAALRRLEQPRLGFHGARKGAAHVAEQLAFKQRGHNRRAIDGQEWARAPRAGLMKRAGREFLSRAGLAAQEH